MQPLDARGRQETGLTVWRRSYYRLRALERFLVQASAGAEDVAELEPLYREIDRLRQETSDLFAAAQFQTVARHVRTRRWEFDGPDPQAVGGT